MLWVMFSFQKANGQKCFVWMSGRSSLATFRGIFARLRFSAMRICAGKKKHLHAARRERAGAPCAILPFAMWPLISCSWLFQDFCYVPGLRLKGATSNRHSWAIWVHRHVPVPLFTGAGTRKGECSSNWALLRSFAQTGSLFPFQLPFKIFLPTQLFCGLLSDLH